MGYRSSGDPECATRTGLMTVERATSLGGMTPGEEREQDEWEEVLNYPSVEADGPVHKCIEKTGGGRGEREVGAEGETDGARV